MCLDLELAHAYKAMPYYTRSLFGCGPYQPLPLLLLLMTKWHKEVRRSLRRCVPLTLDGDRLAAEYYTQLNRSAVAACCCFR